MEFASEIAKATVEINTMQSELSKIRFKAEPIISDRSFLNNPGPGTYAHKEHFGKQSIEAHKPSPRSFTFGRSKQPTFLSRDASDLSYHPNYSSTEVLSPAAGVSVDWKPRLYYIKKISERSPGPIYNLKPLESKGTVFGTGKRDSGNIKHGPSPGEYNTDKSFKYLKKEQTGRFNTSRRENYRKLGVAHTIVLGNVGPGPIYNPVSIQKHSRAASLGRTGHLPFIFDKNSPGVGAYSPTEIKTQKGIGMPRAKRL